MTEDQLYDHLQWVWKKAQERFELTGDPTYDFQEENGRIHLIGARGLLADTLSPCENRSTAWDDTMFVVRKDKEGNREVHTFFLSTEPNDTTHPDHVSTLKYEHLKSYAGKDYKYRALKTHWTGVTTFLDDSHEQKQDPVEKEIADNEINIHYGGSVDTPTGWSHGYQVLEGPQAFHDFMAIVESDK